MHPIHPLHAYYHSIKPAGPIHPFTMSIPLALSIPCLIHSLKLVNPLFIDPIDPIDPEYPISRLRDSKFYKQRNRICTVHVAHVGIYLPFRRFKLMFMQLKFPSVEFVEKTNEGQIHGKRLVTQLKAQNLYQEIKF